RGGLRLTPAVPRVSGPPSPVRTPEQPLPTFRVRAPTAEAYTLDTRPGTVAGVRLPPSLLVMPMHRLGDLRGPIFSAGSLGERAPATTGFDSRGSEPPEPTRWCGR